MKKFISILLITLLLLFISCDLEDRAIWHSKIFQFTITDNDQINLADESPYAQYITMDYSGYWDFKVYYQEDHTGDFEVSMGTITNSSLKYAGGMNTLDIREQHETWFKTEQLWINKDDGIYIFTDTPSNFYSLNNNSDHFKIKFKVIGVVR